MSAENVTSLRPIWEEANAFQIHVVLEGIEPSIWRRLIVPMKITLAEFHHILQAAMGWTNSHLHKFEIGGLSYGDSHILNMDISENSPLTFDSTAVHLRDFRFYYGEGPSFVYEYDFGDSWRHIITLEKLLTVKPAPKTSQCVEGARCCPPEAHSYAEFLRVLLAPEPGEIEEQKHLTSWSGGKFDPELFELAKTDKAVRGALRKRQRKSD